MPHKRASFDEVCRRADGRRAYNKRRRLERARRISAILALQDSQPNLNGRELAARFSVHEATISRELAFITELRADFRRMMQRFHPSLHCELRASSFRWLRDARGHELVFEMHAGRRTR